MSDSNAEPSELAGQKKLFRGNYLATHVCTFVLPRMKLGLQIVEGPRSLLITSQTVAKGGPENFRQDRNFGSTATDPSIRSPHFYSDLDPTDSDVYGLNRKGTVHHAGNSTFDNWRFGEDLGPPPDVKVLFMKNHGNLPEESYLYHEAKKLKTDSFPPDKELPEYPYSDLEQERRALPRAFSDFPQPEAFDKNLEAGPFGYTPIQDRPISLSLPHGERSDPWKVSYDSFQAGSGSLPTNRAERKRFTPEPEPSSLKLWKWEGTIAKGRDSCLSCSLLSRGKSAGLYAA
ncbi:hypothetical protein OIU78_014906 [Salix suchowensis]|nr:hypothetical protein OIU78_014906 [Salix suchowensis]